MAGRGVFGQSLKEIDAEIDMQRGDGNDNDDIMELNIVMAWMN